MISRKIISGKVIWIGAFVLMLSACGGGSDPAPVTTTQPPVNNVPVASDVSIKTNVDEPLDATLIGQDADGDALTYSITAPPTMGTVEILDAATGAFRFTPLTAAFGADQFNYTVNDGNDDSAEAVVTIVVNRYPVAEDQSMRAATSLPADGTLVGTDADADPITFSIATQPANGTVVLDAASGNFTYNATADFEGMDSFTYQTNDGFADSPLGTVTLSVNEWLGTVNLGTADDEYIQYGLQIDEDMNLYVAYSTTGAVPGYVSNGGDDIVLAKIDKAGTVLWQKQYGTANEESPYLLVRHSDGSLYLTVVEREYDPILDTYSVVDNLVVKFDANGDFLWDVSVPTVNTIRQFYRMAVSPNGIVYVNAFDMVESYGWLLRITPDGAIAWTKLLGDADADPADPLLNNALFDSYFVFPRGLAVDAIETIHMNLDVVRTVAGVDSWSTMLASFNGVDGTILSRLDPLLTSAFPLAPALLRDVHLTAAGNLRVLGNQWLPTVPDTLGLVVAELDTAGNEIWATARNVADENREGFNGVLATDGSMFVYGNAKTVLSGDANVDVGLTKFNSAGDFVWESVLGSVLIDGTTDVFDAGSQPAVDANGSVFILMSSDGGAIGSTTNQGGFDVFIVKLDGNTGEMIHP